jgi:Nif-specific regulatory protein
VERAVVFARDDKIRPEALNLASGAAVGDGDYSERTLREALNIFKKHFITKALEANGWHQTRTAKALAIQRSYLSKLVKELGIMKERGV